MPKMEDNKTVFEELLVPFLFADSSFLGFGILYTMATSGGVICPFIFALLSNMI